MFRTIGMTAGAAALAMAAGIGGAAAQNTAGQVNLAAGETAAWLNQANMQAAPGTANQLRWLAEGVRGKRAGDVVIGLSAIGVLPTNGGSVPAIGGEPTASNAATAQLDFTYFFTPSISANLIAATTRHDVSVRNSVLGDVALGRVWALPPTLTVQYHPLPWSRFSPYLGLGVNLTVFYGEGGARNPAVTNVKVGNSVGMAVNFGTDWEIAPNWLLNFDVKKIFFMDPTVRVDTAIGRINATAEINPWVVGAGIRYRF